MTKEYSDFLAHYGVKGQKWGVRNWQNEDGSYTTAGAERYWGGGHGRQPGSGNALYQNYKRYRQPKQAATAVTAKPNRRPPTQEQVEARKKRTRIIIGAAATVAVAALAVYGAKRYRNAAKMRDLLRSYDYKQAVASGRSNEEAARVVRKMHSVRSSDRLVQSIKRNYKKGVSVRPHVFSDQQYSYANYQLKRHDARARATKNAFKLLGQTARTGAQTYGEYMRSKMQYEEQNKKHRKRG